MRMAFKASVCLDSWVTTVPAPYTMAAEDFACSNHHIISRSQNFATALPLAQNDPHTTLSPPGRIPFIFQGLTQMPFLLGHFLEDADTAPRPSPATGT